MTGLARSAAHTASDHATHPRVRVSCSLWTILSQRIIARRSSSGAGYGRPAAARHMCNTSVLDVMGTHVGLLTYPLRDNTGCIELRCPMFSDRTGCQCGQLAALLEVSGAKPGLRDQGTSGAHGSHRLRGRTCPSHLRTTGPRTCLTAPALSVPVGFPSGPRERRVRCGTRAIRAEKA